MDFSVNAASISSQVIAMLLVATMLDPWARGAWSGSRRMPRSAVVASILIYIGKVGAATVLLFNMQVVLFDNPMSGSTGRLIALSNYAAIVLLAMSLIITVVTHFSRRPERTDHNGAS